MSGRAEKPIPSPERTARALAVSPLAAGRVRLREILSQGNWEVHEASDCCGALALLRDESVLSSGRRVPLGAGTESGWFRRADDAFRARGGVANHLRRLEPL